jgi:hypothetical protein
MNSKLLKSALVGLVLLTSFFVSVASAGLMPVGVMNDVEYDTVINDWGWEVLYRDNYGACGWGTNGCAIDDIFLNVDANDGIMFAGINDNLTTFDVLSAALWSDVSTVTVRNQTNEANGSLWYFNGYSIGFTGLNSIITQNSADTTERSERTRLSWHASDISGSSSNNAAAYINSGWRSGSNTSLNGSSQFDRVILINRNINAVSNGQVKVPEPTTLAIFALGLMGLAVRRNKKRS